MSDEQGSGGNRTFTLGDGSMGTKTDDAMSLANPGLEQSSASISQIGRSSDDSSEGGPAVRDLPTEQVLLASVGGQEGGEAMLVDETAQSGRKRRSTSPTAATKEETSPPRKSMTPTGSRTPRGGASGSAGVPIAGMPPGPIESTIKFDVNCAKSAVDCGTRAPEPVYGRGHMEPVPGANGVWWRGHMEPAPATNGTGRSGDARDVSLYTG